LERLEERALLVTSVAEYEPNDGLATAQILRGDTAFEVSASILTLRDVDYYSFPVTTGDTIRVNCRALNPSAPANQQFDPVIGLYTPSGALISRSATRSMRPHGAIGRGP
jgi:hypothetical protein